MTKLPAWRLARHAYLDVIANAQGLMRVGGPWLLAVAHVAPLPEPSLEDLNRRLVERAIPPLHYYNPALHRASFALPTYVHTLLAP